MDNKLLYLHSVVDYLLCLHSFLPLLSLAFFIFHIEALLSLNAQQNVQE